MRAPDPGSGGAATVGQALAEARRSLAAAGIEGAARDARLLLEAASGLSGAALLARPDSPLDPAAARRLQAIVARRAAREPVSRILGTRDFWGRAFRVTAATLDPRPETETLVEAALEIAAAGRTPGSWPRRILDIGTGTGCLAVTLLSELPGATGVAIDASAEALDVARENAARHGVGERLTLVHARAGEYGGSGFDLVVSNPPYIATPALASLAPEVAAHDPRLALDGGADGLAVYREIVGMLPRVLRDGWVLLEVGHDQAEAVEALLAGCGYGEGARRRVWRDLGGIARCVALKTQV